MNEALASSAPALTDDAPHLLVVDDDRRIRALIARYLTGQGYRVTPAGTADEARAKLKALAFDLIILDVTDDDGGSTSYSTEVNVLNLPPSIAPFGPFDVEEADSLVAVASAVDPGSDDDGAW